MKPSFREIEQVLAYYALISNMSKSYQYYPPYQAMIAFICYLKTSKPELIYRIENDDIDSNELVHEAGLSKAVLNGNAYFHIKYLNKLIIFDLATEEVKKEMLKEDANAFKGAYDITSGCIMKKVCSWLSEISI